MSVPPSVALAPSRWYKALDPATGAPEAEELRVYRRRSRERYRASADGKAVVAMLEKALPLGRLGVWDGVLFVESP